VNAERLDEWIHERGWALPKDLVDLWAATGGGQILDSEVLLPPLPASGVEDDVATSTRHYRSKGMPASYVVFHAGACGLSAIRLADRQYVQLDAKEFRELGEYDSLEAWYAEVVRAEFWERYGLARL
jgi:hypothetical protein